MDDATPAHVGLLTENEFPIASLPGGTLTILVKAQDYGGKQSDNAAYVIKDFGDPLTDNIILTDDLKAAGFPGTIVNGSIISDNLKADSATVFWSGSDATPFWSADSTTIFWAGAFKEMTYTASVTPDPIYIPSKLTIDSTIAGDPWTIEYRDNGSTAFWSSNDSTQFWNNDANVFWQPLGSYISWPGSLDVSRQLYQFQIVTAAGLTQGEISELVLQYDVPDIEERFNDISISASGTRLTLTETYRVIKNVQLTLQDDSGTSVSAQTIDKDATDGPLIKTYDTSRVATTGLIDATIQGY